MEKIVKKPITTMRSEHHFECDLCGKYIGMSLELEDGYYEQLGKYSRSFYIDKEWYEINKTLCEDCQKVITSKLIMALKDIGFEKK